MVERKTGVCAACGEYSPALRQRYLCGACYYRHYRDGSLSQFPPAPVRVRSDPMPRYLASVDASGGPDACHPWTQERDPKDGYGKFFDGTRRVGAHRWAYEQFIGPIPDGNVVRHTCDNPPCCNPAHLLVGTTADNNRDRDERQRTCRGEEQHKARLTEEAVRHLRATYKPGKKGWVRDAAAQYGVARGTIKNVVAGKSWKWVA